MLTMRVTPKMSDSPAATRNRPAAEESPLSAWKRRASVFMAMRHCEPPGLASGEPKDKLREAISLHLLRASGGDCFVGLRPPRNDAERDWRRGARKYIGSVRRRPQLLHLGIRRQHGSAIHILEVGHRPGALLERDRPDESAHGGLMIA